MHSLHAILLGIVEGISEFLPISSTGHLILTGKLLSIPSSEFVKSFEIAIQLGAILAAVVLYWKKLVHSRKTMINVLAAFIPTAIIGLAVHAIAKKFLLGNDMVVVWSLLIGGLVLIAFERWHGEGETTKDLEAVTLKQSVIVGLFQAIAIVPGVSRSAATVVGGMLFGMRRSVIVDFSFLLAIPTMAAATGLDLAKSGYSFTGNEWMALGIGFVVAFVTALVAIRWLLSFLKSHTFAPFGVYRIVAAIAYAAVMLR